MGKRKQDDGMWPDWIQPVWVKIPGLHYTRIENELYGGFPDVELLYWGHAAWIELKVAYWPKRKSGRIYNANTDWVRPKQTTWLRKRWRLGGSAWILLRLRDQAGCPLGRGERHYLVPGGYALWLRQRPQVAEFLARPGVIPIGTPQAVLWPLVFGPKSLAA